MENSRFQASPTDPTKLPPYDQPKSHNTSVTSHFPSRIFRGKRTTLYAVVLLSILWWFVLEFLTKGDGGFSVTTAFGGWNYDAVEDRMIQPKIGNATSIEANKKAKDALSRERPLEDDNKDLKKGNSSATQSARVSMIGAQNGNKNNSTSAGTNDASPGVDGRVAGPDRMSGNETIHRFEKGNSSATQSARVSMIGAQNGNKNNSTSAGTNDASPGVDGRVAGPDRMSGNETIHRFEKGNSSATQSARVSMADAQNGNKNSSTHVARNSPGKDATQEARSHLIDKHINDNSTKAAPILTETREGGRQDNDPKKQNSNKKVPPMIHIVYTRFMQHQPELIALGLARLHLLQDFFLTSLGKQSTDNFILVIRIDPRLNKELLVKPLVKLLQSSSLGARTLGVATNDNPESQYYDVLSRLLPSLIVGSPRQGKDHIFWKGGANGTSTDWAVDYLKGGATIDPLQLILETRLDADDGLSRLYLQLLQEQATRHLLPYQPPFQRNNKQPTNPSWPWRIWCSSQSLEWQLVAPWKDESYPFNNSDVGSLVALKSEGCLSAGLTLGYWAPALARNRNDGDAPVLLPPAKEQGVFSIKYHHLVSETVASCERIKIRRQQGLSKNRGPILFCLSFLELAPSSLRSRTPTSAGMLNVLWDSDPNTTRNVSSEGSKHEQVQRENEDRNEQYRKVAMSQKKDQGRLWKTTIDLFGFSRAKAIDLKQYIRGHMRDIAEDNLKGQCTSGHSCKNSSFHLLNEIVSSGGASTEHRDLPPPR